MQAGYKIPRNGRQKSALQTGRVYSQEEESKSFVHDKHGERLLKEYLVSKIENAIRKTYKLAIDLWYLKVLKRGRRRLENPF